MSIESVEFAGFTILSQSTKQSKFITINPSFVMTVCKSRG